MRTILAIVMALTIAGCAYVDIKTPFDTNLNQTEMGSKVGIADAHSVLWLFSWGDASYAKAAENGGIAVMKHADQEIYQVLFGLYTRWRIVVHGD